MSSSPLPLTEAVLRPVRGHHAFEACVEQLATTIRLGVYPRGTALPAERELAARLHVSRATLREAMVALRQAGLVQTSRGRQGGTVVAPNPPTTTVRAAARAARGRRTEWLDALDFRRIVEPGAAALAARTQLSPDQSAQLEEAHRQVAEARRGEDHRQADSRFHLTVAALSGSDRALEAVTSVQAILHDMLQAIPVLQANIAHSHRQHADLVRVILSGHAERARRVMEEHCDDTAALVRGLVG